MVKDYATLQAKGDILERQAEREIRSAKMGAARA
jgi:hypothetical protein